MMKRLITCVLAIGLVGSLMVFSVACSSSDPVPDTPATHQGTTQSQRVVLYNYRFNPATVELGVGSTVTFENQDPEAHNISIPALNVDQNIQPNQTWTLDLNTRGEFAVGNRFDDGMRLDLFVR